VEDEAFIIMAKELSPLSLILTRASMAGLFLNWVKDGGRVPVMPTLVGL
jgi:hypothetical protein